MHDASVTSLGFRSAMGLAWLIVENLALVVSGSLAVRFHEFHGMDIF